MRCWMCSTSIFRIRLSLPKRNREWCRRRLTALTFCWDSRRASSPDATATARGCWSDFRFLPSAVFGLCPRFPSTLSPLSFLDCSSFFQDSLVLKPWPILTLLCWGIKKGRYSESISRKLSMPWVGFWGRCWEACLFSNRARPIPSRVFSIRSIIYFPTPPKPKNRLFETPHFTLGVLAQFLYVAAQTGIGSFFINYVIEVKELGIADREAGTLLGLGGMGLFALGRFVGSMWLRYVKPSTLVGTFALINAG